MAKQEAKESGVVLIFLSVLVAACVTYIIGRIVTRSVSQIGSNEVEKSHLFSPFIWFFFAFAMGPFRRWVKGQMVRRQW